LKINVCEGQTGRLSDSGEPFQTMIVSDQPGAGSDEGYSRLIKELTSLRVKFGSAYSGKSLAVVVDGRVFGAVHINNLQATSGTVTINSDGTPQGEVEQTLVTTYLKSGTLPAQLEIVSNSRK
jgi:preprotein translocase subunit SecD